MKKFLLIVISVFALQGSFAQTVSDYYLPLCVGNYVKFHTPGQIGGWSARTTIYSIVREDIINNEVYYLQKGWEIDDSNPSNSSVFQYIWLRKAANGEILIGAYDTNGSGELSSAVITPPGTVYLPNQSLTLNNSHTITLADGQTSTDLVVSVSATVGNYNNCIQIRNTTKVNGNIEIVEDTYYAYQVGFVKQERTFPANNAFVNSLVDFSSVNCNATGVREVFESNHISIYPNPFSVSTTLKAQTKFKDAMLTVYNSYGQTVRQTGNLSGQTITFHRDNLPCGMYLLRLTENQKTLSVDKLVITD